MDYVKPGQILAAMVEAGAAKAHVAPWPMFVRGVLGGAILGCATALAFTAAAQTNVAMAGALIFPAGFVIIVLLGLELVTGSFALTPLAVLNRRASAGRMLAGFGWALLGHLVGCLFYAALYSLAVTKMGEDPGNGLVRAIIGASEAKTIAYKSMGAEGWLLVTVKAALCNWMVTLGAVLALSSTSTFGKIAAMWLPVLIFFGQGFEHAVVNLFVIPAGMMLGADVSLADWWLWNQIPVLIGNFAGGLLLTGVMFQWAQRDSGPRPEAAASVGNSAAGAATGAVTSAVTGAVTGVSTGTAVNEATGTSDAATDTAASAAAGAAASTTKGSAMSTAADVAANTATGAVANAATGTATGTTVGAAVGGRGA